MKVLSDCMLILDWIQDTVEQGKEDGVHIVNLVAVPFEIYKVQNKMLEALKKHVNCVLCER